MKDSARFISMHFILSLVPFMVIAVIASILELNLNFFADFADWIINGSLLIGVLLFVALNITILYFMQLSIDPRIRRWKLPFISLLLQVMSIVLLACYFTDLSGFIS
jgi:hypothetical protein